MPSHTPLGMPPSIVHDLSLGKIVTAIVTIVVLRFVALAFYRLYFHPLAKFPGPRLYAASNIPRVTFVYRGTIADETCRLHDKYGYIVRIAPNELSINHPDGWKDVHGHHSAGRAGPLMKHPRRYTKTVNGYHDMAGACDADHTRARRIFSHAFSDKALKQQEPLFNKYVELLVQKISEQVHEDPERTFDMVQAYNFTTFDIMGDLTFGEPLDMLSNGEYVPWVKAIFDGIKTGSKSSILNQWDLGYRFLQLTINRLFAKKRLEHFRYAVDRVGRRLERGSDQPDIWNLVLNAKEGKGLDRGEMDANAGLFMIAGTETTATLLSGATYHLLQNPKAMSKLVMEIRGAFSSQDDITIEALQRLPYLHACLEESLRLYPPVPTGLPRLTSPGGAQICGEYVPGGVTVSVHHLATYTSERNFKDPKSFIPERWMGDARFADDKFHALQPFSYGPRNCLGRNLAYHEMRIILTKVLWNFDLELRPESEKWAQQDTYVLWHKHPLYTKLVPVRA